MGNCAGFCQVEKSEVDGFQIDGNSRPVVATLDQKDILVSGVDFETKYGT
jgi:hypothetical protein